jgi:hypothetical protein
VAEVLEQVLVPVLEQLHVEQLEREREQLELVLVQEQQLEQVLEQVLLQQSRHRSQEQR